MEQNKKVARLRPPDRPANMPRACFTHLYAPRRSLRPRKSTTVSHFQALPTPKVEDDVTVSELQPGRAQTGYSHTCVTQSCGCMTFPFVGTISHGNKTKRRQVSDHVTDPPTCLALVSPICTHHVEASGPASRRQFHTIKLSQPPKLKTMSPGGGGRAAGAGRARAIFQRPRKETNASCTARSEKRIKKLKQPVWNDDHRSLHERASTSC